MQTVNRTVIILSIVVLAASCGAALHVPGQYQTIQSALNATLPGDTVLVEVGVYAEALQFPGRAVVLKGNVVPPDTGDYPRPSVDPSSLANPRMIRCARISWSNTVIEDFAFRNGWQMYPRQTGNGGGIWSTANDVTMRRCLFDSTSVGVWSDGARLTLEGCVFRDNQDRCVDGATGSGGSHRQITATDCRFGGRCDWAALTLSSNSRLTRCTVSDTAYNAWLIAAYGDSIVFQDCLFGPFGPAVMDGFSCYTNDLQVLNCVVANFNANGGVFGVATWCDHPAVFRGNRFHDITVLRANRSPIISAGAGDTVSCNALIAQNNTFDSCAAPAFQISSSGEAKHNRFNPFSFPGFGIVYAGFEAEPGRSVSVHDNLFHTGGIAMDAESPGTLFADHNWWGDATGPYNSSFNPAGRGDTVGNNVSFDPWYTDTLFLLTAHEPRVAVPLHNEIAAYPNPFNSECRIKLSLSQPEIVRIELFDILGRRTRELWLGPVAVERELRFDASDLPSGVYFVRASDTILHRLLATSKVVLVK